MSPEHDTNQPLIVWKMLTNVQKSRIPQWWKKWRIFTRIVTVCLFLRLRNTLTYLKVHEKEESASDVRNIITTQNGQLN